jgi:hypothetical protein
MSELDPIAVWRECARDIRDAAFALACGDSISAYDSVSVLALAPLEAQGAAVAAAYEGWAASGEDELLKMQLGNVPTGLKYYSWAMPYDVNAAVITLDDYQVVSNKLSEVTAAFEISGATAGYKGHVRDHNFSSARRRMAYESLIGGLMFAWYIELMIESASGESRVPNRPRINIDVNDIANSLNMIRRVLAELVVFEQYATAAG